MVKTTVPEAKTAVQRKSLDRLNEHQRALYDIITERKIVEPQTLYTAYHNPVDESKPERILGDYLRKLR